MRALFIAAALIPFLSSCSLPPFMGRDDPDAPATTPAGPKVASLIANLKCELWVAANDPTKLTYYKDTPSLEKKSPTAASYNKTGVHEPTRDFSLRNLFQEIDFIAEAQFTLDVTGSGGINPSISYIAPLTGSSTFTLGVSGQLSDTAHRNSA